MSILAIIGVIAIVLVIVGPILIVIGGISCGPNYGAFQTTCQTLVPVCSKGVHALCFAEGYVILTESFAEARAVCADLGLDLNPYWSEIVQYYPNRATVFSCMKELESYIGASASSFATIGQDGLSIAFQGYISTIK